MASVLLVDDDLGTLINVAHLVQAIMETKGIVGTVHKASNGIDGLRIFKRNEEEIVLVIADVEMLDMNGVEMLQKIKTVSPATITALHTAHDDPKILQQIMETGVVDFILQKGGYVKDFVAAVEGALTGKQ